MEGLFIGIIWLIVVGGGISVLAALVAMAKAPYRNR
ncbi:hypothetical protein Lxx17010 [Leifsonia xyli subsp. xyli str. CTCB07]|uniref:Uncharacterized protein n=1 Tax=Leifsonia xyli subsp. xyli (strain CTCB07) TaxID=281090 RepID=Q6ADT0_LEIXX|nr:hypothetical protein Lxx17010 [Leifsonia xyli subsp. xyli str. CTCB07]